MFQTFGNLYQSEGGPRCVHLRIAFALLYTQWTATFAWDFPGIDRLRASRPIWLRQTNPAAAAAAQEHMRLHSKTCTMHTHTLSSAVIPGFAQHIATTPGGGSTAALAIFRPDRRNEKDARSTGIWNNKGIMLTLWDVSLTARPGRLLACKSRPQSTFLELWGRGLMLMWSSNKKNKNGMSWWSPDSDSSDSDSLKTTF